MMGGKFKMRPDFRNFRGIGNDMLLHSAKGSTWENHKYIKRLNGTYYYPDSYEGGRHLPDGESDGGSDEPPEIKTDENGRLSSEDVEKLAMEVIRGNFGNGQVRKDLLGDFYKQIQTRVNEIMRSSSGSTKMSDANSEEGQKAVEKVVKSAAASGPSLDFEKIFEVYRKK